MLQDSTLLQAIHQPEYTGENRCYPCTLLNVLIASGLGIGAGLLSPITGLVFTTTSIILIYYRGYLIPGTPYITKAYFPESLLELFGKSNYPEELNLDFDAEALLFELGVITQQGDELALSGDFVQHWTQKAQNSNKVDKETVIRELGFDEETTLTEVNDRTIVHNEGVSVLRWDSDLSVQSDHITLGTLSNYDHWNKLSPEQRAQVVYSLRIFLEQCAECGGQIRPTQREIGSCCHSREELAYVCNGCDQILIGIADYPEKIQPNG